MIEKTPSFQSRTIILHATEKIHVRYSIPNKQKARGDVLFCMKINF